MNNRTKIEKRKAVEGKDKRRIEKQERERGNEEGMKQLEGIKDKEREQHKESTHGKSQKAIEKGNEVIFLDVQRSEARGFHLHELHLVLG